MKQVSCPDGKHEPFSTCSECTHRHPHRPTLNCGLSGTPCSNCIPCKPYEFNTARKRKLFLSKFIDAANAFFEKGAMHPDDWEDIEEEYKACYMKMENILERKMDGDL